MTTPETVARVDGSTMLGRLLASVPPEVRARVQPDERSTARDVESAEEARARRAVASAHRRAQWDARCPAMYRGARVDDLLAEEQHRERLRRWLVAGEARTLVLRSQDPGLGKTHAAYALGHVAVSQGLWTLAYTVADLNAALRPDGEPGAWEAATGCDLLILDDLGREHDTGWTQEQLHRLLDARGREHKRTIVTTNLSGDQMVDRYGWPLIDRLQDGAWVLAFTGESRRRQAPW